MGEKQSLLYYYQKFDHTRLTFARELRGMTKKDLADKIGKKPSAITQFEHGASGLAFETFADIVRCLNVHPALLSGHAAPLPVSDMASCHFRANKRVPQIMRQSARCYALQVLSIFEYFEGLGVQFPECRLAPYDGPKLSEQQMEQYAVEVRKALGLKLGPVRNMAELLESIGIRVVILDGDAAGQLDAFAAWIDGRPCVMLDKSCASRMPFDLAHEFAHLLLDENTAPGDLMAERRANRFASAFLMPAQSFAANCPQRYGRAEFLALKEFWRVSIAAALYRGRLIGCMTERAYTNAMISRAKAGENIHEPGEFEPPMPTLLAQAARLVCRSATLDEMSEKLSILPEELETILLRQNVDQDVIDAMKPAKPKGVVLQFKPQKR